mgnify:FL=1
MVHQLHLPIKSVPLKFGFDSGRPHQVYLEVLGDHFVLEADVGFLVGHLAVEHQVPHVALLDEPLEKLAEGPFECHFLLVVGNQQHG